jgi:hypothetical protein
MIDVAIERVGGVLAQILDRGLVWNDAVERLLCFIESVPRAFRDALAATDLNTVIGPVKFRPDGTGIVQAVFVQWINGKQELVWPKDSATAALVYPAPPFSKR